jgi:CheY-like chemotaxis protein
MKSRQIATAWAWLRKASNDTINLKYRQPSDPHPKTKVSEYRDQQASPAVLRERFISAMSAAILPPNIKSEVRAMKAIRSAPKLVVVIDDDPLVLEATGSLLHSWGCSVVAAESYDAALMRLAKMGRRPDLIICDYRLSEGATGVEAIEGLRSAFEIPALLISGDPSSPSAEGGFNSYSLLHKPLDAARFRAALIDASVL